MRAAIINVSAHVLVNWLKDPPVSTNLPQDARVLGVFTDVSRPSRIYLMLSSSTFDEVPEGEVAPEFNVTCNQ